MVNKLRKLIYKFNALKNILDKKNLQMIYNSLVESVLRYGIIAWGGLYDNNLQPLNICQKHIQKIMLKKEMMYPTNLLFKEAEVANIRYLYYIAVLNYFYKSEKITINHDYNTRSTNSSLVWYNKPTLELVKRTFVFIGPKIYNLIPDKYKQIRNPKRFFNEIKDFVLKNNLNENLVNTL